MRKIKDVLRLSAQGLSARQIAQSIGISRGAVGAYKSRANAAGLIWPLSLDLTDTALEGLLFPCSVQVLSATFPQPDWGHVHVELKRKGVTLALLWEEYRGVHPDGYGYSRYCELYRTCACSAGVIRTPLLSCFWFEIRVQDKVVVVVYLGWACRDTHNHPA